MCRWHDEGIVVLGDAGHAMSPQLGQGVNLALADAACLARCMARHPLEKALRRYQRRRWAALRYYQLATRWLTPWFQSEYEWLSPIRRMFFAIAGRIPIARRMMTRTMAGLIGHRE
jgi:2-polyprenyl-6-methoxyphenol hydroxylase-like FAD-dependent oxidoreductase